MDLLTFEQFDRKAVPYDEAVSRSPDIDRFCSSSLWLLPSVRSLMPPSRPHLLHGDGVWIALSRSGHDETVLHPLEAMWGLGCPLIGEDPEAVVDAFLSHASADDSWDIILLTGLPESSALWKQLVPEARRHFQVSPGPTTRRFVADLTGGVDGFLSRRSTALRANLRKAERRAASRGVTFDVSEEDADASYERLLRVERRSWKGLRGVGIDRDPMCSFYRDMNRRLVARGARRLTFARLDGEDVAYILGGVFDDTYRGLQFSFDHRFADLSLGNLCQLEEVRRLTEAGFRRYDLGSEVRYKKRWGELVFATTALLLRR